MRAVVALTDIRPPGHQSLLVTLSRTGAILLTGEHHILGYARLRKAPEYYE